MSEPLPRHARRLLESLASEGARARRTDLRPGFLQVSAPKNGVTKVLANLPEEAAALLLEHGLAQWRGDALHATEEGRAHARRLASPQDGFQAQHQERATELRGGRERVTVDTAESPLAWLARRRGPDGRPLIEPHEFEAGERFRRDVTAGQLLPSVTSNWSAQSGAGLADPSRLLLPSEVALAARQRVGRALDALGPEFAGLVLDACGFLKRLELIESERGWPPRSGKVVLRMGLGRLARHYGLSSQAQGPSRARARRHWGAEDFRPSVNGGPEPD